MHPKLKLTIFLLSTILVSSQDYSDYTIAIDESSQTLGIEDNQASSDDQSYENGNENENASQSLKTINLGDSTTLLCDRPVELEVSRQPQEAFSIVWDYAKDLESYQKKDTNVIVLHNKVDLDKKDIEHLSGQVSVDQGSADISLTANTISAGGVYVCRDPTKEITYSEIQVNVISYAELYIGESEYVADKMANFNCEASKAFPKPEVSIFKDNEKVTPIREDSVINPTTGLYKVTVEYDFKIDADRVTPLNFRCEASSDAWDADLEPLSAERQVQYKPSIKEVTNLEVTAGTTNHPIECVSQGNPENTIEWQGLEQFPEGAVSTSEDGSKIFINEASNEAHNNKTIKCVARNKHGSDSKAATIIIVEPVTNPQTGGISSNTILIIGIVIAIVVLSIIGLTVMLKRKKNSSQYETNEDNKEAGPEGVDYEQNPEREALAPEEQQQQKELLM